MLGARLVLHCVEPIATNVEDATFAFPAHSVRSDLRGFHASAEPLDREMESP